MILFYIKLRFWQEVKVKLGSLFAKYFLTIKDLYNGVKIGSRIFLLFNFRFGQEVKVNLGSHFCNYLTIDDLYNGAKIVNLPLVVVEIWFFFNITLWLPVWTGSKGQIGVTFKEIFFANYRSVQFYKNCEFTSCGCWDMILFNSKL